MIPVIHQKLCMEVDLVDDPHKVDGVLPGAVRGRMRSRSSQSANICRGGKGSAYRCAASGDRRSGEPGRVRCRVPAAGEHGNRYDYVRCGLHGPLSRV